MDVRELSELVKEDLHRKARKGNILRAVRQFIMDVDRSNDPVALIGSRPPTTSDPKWDALIAGVVEDICVRHQIPTPTWAVECEPLDVWWFVTDFPGLHAGAFVETPPAIARHGVFIRRASLVNI